MKELRTIIFEEREAAGAVIELCRRTKRRTPTGTLKSFEIFEEAVVVGVLTVVDDHGLEHDMSFNQEEIAAALVNYCLNRSVPLPKGASKMITSVDGQIVLALEIGHTADVKQLVRAGAGGSAPR